MFVNKMDKIPSLQDVHYLNIIRDSVAIGIQQTSTLLSGVNSALNVLVIAPSNDKDLAPFKEPRYKIVTLDIDPSSNPDVCGDITKYNSSLKDDFFDCVICTEVIEHVTNPWSAISELMRVTKKGGVLLFTSPFNFRIHGPLPDNFRISEYGWRALLIDHEILSLNAVETPDRALFPIHYRIIVKKS
jgi:SAM-dependent methyltransferase